MIEPPRARPRCEYTGTDRLSDRLVRYEEPGKVPAEIAERRLAPGANSPEDHIYGCDGLRRS